MINNSAAYVLVAERLEGGVYVEFADGTSALFPASFLQAHSPWYGIDLPVEMEGSLD